MRFGPVRELGRAGEWRSGPGASGSGPGWGEAGPLVSGLGEGTRAAGRGERKEVGLR